MRRTQNDIVKLMADVLALNAQGLTCPQIAAQVGVTRGTARKWILESGDKLNLTRELFTDEQKQVIRSNYQTMPAAEIGKLIGRSTRSVYCAAKNMGLSEPIRPRRPDWKEVVQSMVAQGFSQAEIGKALGMKRESARDILKSLGLKTNGQKSEHGRKRVAEKTRQQCEKAGASSLTEIQKRAFRQFAIDNGWPEDIRPRAVHILEALCRHGGLTRRQICEEIGMPWKGARKSLRSNDPEGSYLANLQARGLVIRSPRLPPQRSGRRKQVGCGVHLYVLSPLARQIKSEFLVSKESPNVEGNNSPHNAGLQSSPGRASTAG